MSKKISQLGLIETPNLLGSSVLPIVQSGTTQKVTVDSIKYGNIVSTYSTLNEDADLESTTTLKTPFDNVVFTQGITFDTNKFNILTDGLYEITYRVSLVGTISNNNVVYIWLEDPDLSRAYDNTGVKLLLKNVGEIVNYSETIQLQLVAGDVVSLNLRTDNTGVKLVKVSENNPIPFCPATTFSIKLLGTINP